MKLNSCFLYLKGAVFGAISSLIELAPFFPSCSSKPAQLSGSYWTALCSGVCSVTHCCWGNRKILNWGPSSSALESMLFTYCLQYTRSSVCHTCLRVTGGLKHFFKLFWLYFLFLKGKNWHKCALKLLKIKWLKPSRTLHHNIVSMQYYLKDMSLFWSFNFWFLFPILCVKLCPTACPRSLSGV